MTPAPQTIWIVRALFMLISVSLGIYAANATDHWAQLYDFVLLSAFFGLILVVAEGLSTKTSLRTVSSIFFGLLVGFIGAQLFVVLITFRAENFKPEHVGILRLALTAILCYFSVSVLLRTGDQWRFVVPYIEFRRHNVHSDRPIIVDTSCLIDGRIEGISKQNLFDNPLLVPRCVVRELQALSDSKDKSKRNRGRRGLDILQKMQRDGRLDVLAGPDATGNVDAFLIVVAKENDAKLMTTDRGLARTAEIEGLPVIDLSQLERVFRPRLVPGEAVQVELSREGDEQGQAVGFLDDGTMLVVQDAREKIGKLVEVIVTKSLQTTGGRIAFAKLGEDGPSVSASSDSG